MSDCTVVYGDLSKSTTLEIDSIADILKTIAVEPPEEPIFTNTWGDAFVTVFQSAKAGLTYALDVRDGLRYHDWRIQGIQHAPSLRTAVAIGPVTWIKDKLQGRSAPKGEVFVEAGRIEPTVTPGDVFATQAIQQLAGTADFYYEDLGLCKLPKDYGETHLFRVFRSVEKRAISQGKRGPLIDNQFLRRADALRRFAFLWLLLDQLPIGSWGRSIMSWMQEVWRGIPRLTPSTIMEEEGGFETTILNLELLCHILGPEKLLQSVGARAIQYLERRHDPRGFGTLSLSRHGLAVEPHPRHTALVAWLLGNALKDMTLNIPELSNLFKTSVLALLGGDPKVTAEAFKGDRNPLLLYMAVWCAYQQSQSSDWANLFTSDEQKHMKTTWLASEKGLLPKALATECVNGRPRELVEERQIIFPLTIPYAGFMRMESYSLLSAAMLIDARMPKKLRDRMGLGIKFIIDDYINSYGDPEKRYTRDPLQPKLRGPKPYFAADSDRYQELGIAAMLLRVLRTPKIRQALWEDHVPSSTQKVRYFLSEDLIELFDRYLIAPTLYSLTHAGMFAALLVGDHNHLQTDVINKCQDIIRQPPPLVLTESSIDTVLSEQRLGCLVEDIVVNDNLTPKIQMSAHSLVRLLLDKLRPGRYLQEKLSDSGVQKVSKQTCDVYKRQSFVEKYNKIWGDMPDLAILAPFVKIVRPSASILDVGCGPGHYAAELSKDGYKVSLLDISRAFLDMATKRVRQVVPLKTACFECDVLDPVARSQVGKTDLYEAIWCSGLFVHIPRAKQSDVLKWFYHLLKPGGYLFVNVIVGNPCVFGRDGRYFTYIKAPTELQVQLSDCGFEAEYMLQRTVHRNTYGEPLWQNVWANFYSRKCTSSEKAKFDDAPISLTTQAYERSVDEFISAHKHPDSERVKCINSYLNKLHGFLKDYRPEGSYSILDPGCGPGDYVVEMARRGWKAVGVDISDKMIQFARKHCPPDLKNLAEFYLGDMRDLPLEWTEKFDAIMCVTAFQHIPFEGEQAFKTLREFARVLRSNGILRVDLQLGRETGYDPDLRFIQGVSKTKEARSIFTKAGFDVLKESQWELKPGKNSYRRPIVFRFVEFWLKKQGGTT